MSKAKELREKRAGIAAQMAELIKGGTLTPEQRVSFDKMDEEQKVLKADIDRIERQDALEIELRGSRHVDNSQIDGRQRTPEVIEKEYRKAFFRALCLPRGEGFRSRSSAFLQERGNTDQTKGLEWAGSSSHPVKATLDKCLSELRDNEAGTQSISYTQGAAGGYFVPAGFVYDVEIATKYFAPMADGSVIRILETATGNVLPYPTNNDTQEAWTIIGEASQVSDQGQTPNYPTSGTAPSGQPGNLTMGVVNFGAWKGSTGLVRVSLELLQDSAFNLEDFLKNAFAVRLGRGYEYYLTRGSGVNQPTGIVTAVVASGQAATIAAGSNANDGIGGNTGANSIGTNDLINLEHSIDPTYRRGARFLFHDNTLKVIKQLLDKYGRPLWVPGLASNAPDTILGYEYVINQSMPTIAAAANTVLFGSLNKFLMRKVRDLSVLRLDERFADFGEVAFIAFSRIDSNLVDAGVHPIGYLQQHS
jgi:HK97 family phage major capsid protein